MTAAGLGAGLVLRASWSASDRRTAHVWPDQLDGVVTVSFLLAVLGLGGLGYLFMALDLRAYVRSLRRALVCVSSYGPRRPAWARPYTPPSIAALGLTMPCTEADVLKAYRRQVKALHPDRGGDRQRFLRLQAGFEEALQHVRAEQSAR